MISRLIRHSMFIEWLESRIAPAANLVTTIIDLELPTPVVPGDSGRVTFEVRNDGPDDAIVQGDTTGIHIYLSADNQKNGADEPPIAELENLHTLDLPAGATKIYRASFVIPPLTLPTPKYPAGASYFIVVEADAGFRVTNELTHADNDGASAPFPLVFQFGAVDERTDVRLRARDADGTVASFGVRGPGTGTLTVGGGQADLSVIDTTPKTAQLSGSASGGGDDRLAVRNISVAGPLKDVFLPGVNVTGMISLAGGLGTLTLGGAVTLTTSKDPLSAANFVFAPDGTLQLIDLNQQGGDFGGANITVRGKPSAGGDELLNVGAIDAVGINLGKVKIQGDLGQIDAGSNSGKAIKSLTLGSLGTNGASNQVAGTLNPLLSQISGSVGKLTVKGDVLNAVVEVSEKLGKVLIGGNLVDSGAPAPLTQRPGSIGVFLNGGIPPANASHAGTIFAPNIGSVTVMGDVNGGEISAEAQIKNVKIVGKLMSDDPLDPAILRVGEGIKKVLINGDVQNALILAGYNRGLAPRNPDASIGKVTVKGDWSASSVVAGVADPTDNGFGINDMIIAGDTTPDVLSKIASVIIKGTASGSIVATDHSAITAQEISALRISGERVQLSDDLDDISLDSLKQNFRAVEL